MKFIDSMNDYMLDMYNMSDMIFMLLLCIDRLHYYLSKEKMYPFTTHLNTLLRHFLSMFLMYVLQRKFRKINIKYKRPIRYAG